MTRGTVNSIKNATLTLTATIRLQARCMRACVCVHHGDAACASSSSRSLPHEPSSSSSLCTEPALVWQHRTMHAGWSSMHTAQHHDTTWRAAGAGESRGKGIWTRASGGLFPLPHGPSPPSCPKDRSSHSLQPALCACCPMEVSLTRADSKRISVRFTHSAHHHTPLAPFGVRRPHPPKHTHAHTPRYVHAYTPPPPRPSMHSQCRAWGCYPKALTQPPRVHP